MENLFTKFLDPALLPPVLYWETAITPGSTDLSLYWAFVGGVRKLQSCWSIQTSSACFVNMFIMMHSLCAWAQPLS